MNVKTKAVLGTILAMVLGFFLFGGTSQAASHKQDCVVVNNKITEETLKRPEDGKIFGYRYVRVETLRCGTKYTDIKTVGEYQKTPVFRNVR